MKLLTFKDIYHSLITLCASMFWHFYPLLVNRVIEKLHTATAKYEAHKTTFRKIIHVNAKYMTTSILLKWQNTVRDESFSRHENEGWSVWSAYQWCLIEILMGYLVYIFTMQWLCSECTVTIPRSWRTETKNTTQNIKVQSLGAILKFKILLQKTF